MLKHIEILDSTLRDGAQGEGISFSVPDKLKILKAMDESGINMVEAGNPGSNPKDLEFFRQALTLELKHTQLAAFGSTRRRDIAVEDDGNVQSLLKAQTPVVVIFGKSWDLHVKEIIKTTKKENLAMIWDTVRFFTDQGKTVVFDAEHYYDGYHSDAAYALETLKAAREGGASTLVLCDTNGGSLPSAVYTDTKAAIDAFSGDSVEIGVHCHNDSGMAEANSVMAVEAGASHVQGTFVGFGERCGNANLSTIIPTIQLKLGMQCIPEEALQSLTATAHRISEIANIPLGRDMPYVGKSAFAHKGGMHIDGVAKNSSSFEHIHPDAVGNSRRFLMSEVAGRSMVLNRIQKFSPELSKDSKETKAIIEELKQMEMDGYQFEGAESSFELLIRKHLGKYKPFFELDHYRTIGEQPASERNESSSAIVKVRVDGTEEITAAQGDGPVNALDKALRKALEVFYPSLKSMHLTDYKVRVLDTKEATAARVRVLIESTDGTRSWTTVGVSTDIIEASWIALVDSIEYKLLMEIERTMSAYF